jgi:hypothetical protein
LIGARLDTEAGDKPMARRNLLRKRGDHVFNYKLPKEFGDLADRLEEYDLWTDLSSAFRKAEITLKSCFGFNVVVNKETSLDSNGAAFSSAIIMTRNAVRQFLSDAVTTAINAEEVAKAKAKPLLRNACEALLDSCTDIEAEEFASLNMKKEIRKAKAVLLQLRYSLILILS